MPDSLYPCSPKDTLHGLPYFPRLCEKIRLHSQNQLHPDLHANLGKAMDLWTCQFLGITYHDLKAQILAGASNEDALSWAEQNGTTREPYERDWFIAYLTSRGFRDDLSERLQARLHESGFQNRPDLLTFFDYIDADEGRI